MLARRSKNKAMKLNLPRRTQRRLPKRVQQPMVIEARANAEWPVDFMGGTLYHGRRFCTLNVLDEGAREALDIVIDTSIPGGPGCADIGSSDRMAWQA